MIGYLDESGGHGFDFSNEGTSKFFVVTAVVVKPQGLDELKRRFLEIKNQYYPVSELKSSKVRNEKTRKEIFDKISTLDFRFHCLVVDKQQINRDSGLMYKESFYKFLYGLLYNSLYRTFPTLDLFADKMISDEFTQSFRKYVDENHKADLFNQQSIHFLDSKEAELLQLSDFIGGTMNRFYSKKSDIDPSEILASKSNGIVLWPKMAQQLEVESNLEEEQHEHTISELALLRINSYLTKNLSPSDTLTKARVMFLEYLKFTFSHVSKRKFTTTSEIADYLKPHFEEIIKEQFIRQQIVGPLRTEGILIVSNSSGYKIPSTKNDVVAFFNLFNRMISPMLKRLKTTHEALYSATNGELDMMAYPEFALLKKAIDD